MLTSDFLKAYYTSNNAEEEQGLHQLAKQSLNACKYILCTFSLFFLSTNYLQKKCGLHALYQAYCNFKPGYTYHTILWNNEKKFFFLKSSASLNCFT